jgi:hypothetical protein
MIQNVYEMPDFGCPDCGLPIDSEMQKTNIRMEGEDRILSCPWCWKVYNIGPPTKSKDILSLYC